ncbi:MAG: hypothetical protein QME32_04180 [Endomicrobiia bacterium]|nr:hypothetical protein [Endomicrobiia bacterium]
MIPVIVISHGGIARELVAMSRIIVGEHDALDTLEIASASTIDSVKERISQKVSAYERAPGFGGALILTDMLGGSSCNVCVPLVAGHKVAIVSGVNLYMLLSALKNRESLALDELKKRVIADGIRSIADVCEIFVK